MTTLHRSQALFKARALGSRLFQAKEKECISPFNTRAVVKTRPHLNLLYFSLTIPSLRFYGPPSPDLREVMRCTYF